MPSALSLPDGSLPAWRRPYLLLATVAALSVALPAGAHEGYAQNVKDECAKAGRPVPAFSVSNCAICHERASNQRAYASGDYLDVFCKVETAPDGGGSVANTAPVLENLASPQTAVAGQVFRVGLAASDAEDDFLKLIAKKLPAGARLGKTQRSNGKWTATMTWKPRKGQASKTFTTQFIAIEKRRRPRLQALQTVEFFVGPASAAARSLGILQARYESGLLSVAGTIVLPSGPSVPPSVEIRRRNGEILGTAAVTDGGDWTLNLELPPDRAPCEIRAVADGETLAAEPVRSTQTGCQ